MYFLMTTSFLGPLILTNILFLKKTKSMHLTLEILNPQNYYHDCSVMTFHMDYMALIFLYIIFLISMMIFMYSKYYMNLNMHKYSTDNNRFLMILLFFVMSMVFLVFSGSWVTLMLGWDGLGISSFFLVIFYNNMKSINSGLITFLTNRLGDSFFILSFIWMKYNGIFNLNSFMSNTNFMFILMIILGAMTKSAQYPFMSWLPAAMAAPTPVSSLVHSSTLVTAGVYVMIRFNFLISPLTSKLNFLFLATMMISSLSANLEMDFKKVIAMSTLSQLGFMMYTISLSYTMLAFFHVIFHAMFKSSLFLSTGGLMHEMFSNQDSRSYGNTQTSFLSKIFFMTCCLNLMGFPFTLGFYSKDSILSNLFMLNFNFLQIIFYLTCCLTISYSIRILTMSFIKNLNNNSMIKKNEQKKFFFPILMLSLNSTFMGNFFLSEFFHNNIFSMLDCLLGLLAIPLGLIMFLIFMKIKMLKTFFKSLTFLFMLLSYPLNKNIKYFPTFKEKTWMEMISNKGFMSTINMLFMKNFKLYNNHMIFFSPLLIFML